MVVCVWVREREKDENSYSLIHSRMRILTHSSLTLKLQREKGGRQKRGRVVDLKKDAHKDKKQDLTR